MPGCRWLIGPSGAWHSVEILLKICAKCLSPNHRRNHPAGRPPRCMPAWQRRIAAFLGREL
jgi:hypothetical protein